VYNIGGGAERKNLDVVETLCDILVSWAAPRRPVPRPRHVRGGRPATTRRYAMDTSKIEAELGWRPGESLESGLRKTVQWYLDNADWVASVQTGAYRNWVETNYGGR
jgi:dTDP-glucose 4,6-dehydratase